MAGLGRKVFTAGDVLTASDTMNYLMDQTVMNFAGTAARSSAIATPTEGMTSYIGVTGTATIPQLETYTGSAWQTPYGLTQIANVTLSGATTVTLDNVFSSAFENYVVLSNLNSSGNGDVLVSLRTAAGATDTNLHQYSAWYQGSTGTNLTNFFGNATTSWNGAYIEGGVQSSQIKWEFFSPQVSTRRTGFMANHVRYTASNSQANSQVSGIHSQVASYAGFTFTGPAGISGNVRVYGYRNS